MYSYRNIIIDTIHKSTWNMAVVKRKGGGVEFHFPAFFFLQLEQVQEGAGERLSVLLV